jgi:hypothetical protein
MREKKLSKPKTVDLPPGYLDSPSFDQATYDRQWLVQGILMAEQAAVIGGAKKSLKTSIAVDLAISLGSGKPFLGCFAVPESVRVAVLSGESGASVLQETARRIAISKRTKLSDCDVIWSDHLPRLDKSEDRRELRESLEKMQAKVVIIDPLYLCLLSIGKGASASNLFEVGPVLMRTGRACLDAGATPIFVHHMNKGSSGKNAGTDLGDLAFAGIAEFARQWLLVARRQPYEPGSGEHHLTMVGGGSAGHSGKWSLKIREEILNKDMGGRNWKVSVAAEHADPSVGFRNELTNV